MRLEIVETAEYQASAYIVVLCDFKLRRRDLMLIEDNQAFESGKEKAEFPTLDFSIPQVRYESTASFTNTEGQKFTIRVSGLDIAAVEKYSKELQVYFNVLPGAPIFSLPDEQSQPKEEKVDQPSKPEINIDIELVEQIKKPDYTEGAFAEELTIDEWEDITFIFNPSPNFEISFSVEGSVNIKITRIRDGKEVYKKTLNSTISSTPINPNKNFRDNDKSKGFKMVVNGNKNDSRFFFNSNVEFKRQT